MLIVLEFSGQRQTQHGMSAIAFCSTQAQAVSMDKLLVPLGRTGRA